MSAKKKSTRSAGSGKGANAAAEAAEPTFEEALARLEELVARLEEGEVPLEESLQAYAEGVKLIRQCAGRLDSAEAMIRELNESEDGLKLSPSPLNDAIASEDDPGEDDEAGW